MSITITTHNNVTKHAAIISMLFCLVIVPFYGFEMPVFHIRWDVEASAFTPFTALLLLLKYAVPSGVTRDDRRRLIAFCNIASFKAMALTSSDT